MDFDLELEFFMEEVSRAVRHSSPHHNMTGKRPNEAITIDDDENEGMSSSSDSDACPIYSTAKRRRLDYGRCESIQTDSSVSSENEVTSYEVSAKHHDHDEMPSYFHPSLDMTTALVSAEPRLPPSLHALSVEAVIPNHNIEACLMYKERLELVPNFYTYTVKSCLLPIRRVQNILVTLYFHHIHPMFPVVDEYHITELHRKYRGKEELMEPSDFSVYHAIMVAGFAHLTEAQILNTPYRSVLEGQEAQVEQLKARYWSQPATDPYTLTQISLLLSLWSPGWIGPQNNSYWLDQAFKHASAAKLFSPPPSSPNSSPPRSSTEIPSRSRRLLLAWCCLIRDRVLALGMRRPHRLHTRPSFQSSSLSASSTTPLPLPKAENFGLEATYPAFPDKEGKDISILAFIWFCRLGEVMEGIAVVQRRLRFARDWNGDKGEEIGEEVELLRGLEGRLDAWEKGFEEVVSGVVDDGKEGEVRVPIETLRIMVHSLKASLYQPYLHLPTTHPALKTHSIDPLHRMKEGANRVARSVHNIIRNKKSDAIPTRLVSWITLPVAIYHVSNLLLTKPPDEILMPFLAQLVRRSSGAKMLLMTVRTATRDMIERIARDEWEADGSGRGRIEDGDKRDEERDEERSTKKTFQFVHSKWGREENEMGVGVLRSTEAKLLGFVTRKVDEALEANGSVR